MPFLGYVTGTKEKVLDTQTSFEHLFQRPNTPEVSIHVPRTALTGTRYTFRIGNWWQKRRQGPSFKF